MRFIFGNNKVFLFLLSIQKKVAHQLEQLVYIYYLIPSAFFVAGPTIPSAVNLWAF